MVINVTCYVYRGQRSNRSEALLDSAQTVDYLMFLIALRTFSHSCVNERRLSCLAGPQRLHDQDF
jgi:hypothetical protein